MRKPNVRKKIVEKIKQDVIKAHENGVPRKKIAERFGISLSSVGRIVKKKAPEHSHETETDTKTERQKGIEDLERRINELEIKILEYEAKKKAKKRYY
jgi:DNA invertase Pin-like site-specific DNA recombinase